MTNVSMMHLGSSPQAWSGQAMSAERNVNAGLTSAGAERTRSAHTCPVSGWGSSPQARSGPDLATDLPPNLGLISAGAERTRSPINPEIHLGAHLRRRGADSAREAARVPVGGSSPQARSGHRFVGEFEADRGLISAGAERTCDISTLSAAHWAHLRRRGADSPLVVRRSRRMGSSPQARSGQPT